MIIKQTKKNIPQNINYFLLPIIEKTNYLNGWGGEKLHVKGWGLGRAKKVSQKQHAKSGPKAAWQKVAQKQPAKSGTEGYPLHYFALLIIIRHSRNK